jgi:hypothetical protein
MIKKDGITKAFGEIVGAAFQKNMEYRDLKLVGGR